MVADPPIVLAPMAGITNTAFRRLCRSSMSGVLEPGRAGGLSVSELYGVDPAVVRRAVDDAHRTFREPGLREQDAGERYFAERLPGR